MKFPTEGKRNRPCRPYLAALLARLMLVAPANTVLATWTSGPVAKDFGAVRLRWKTGHMAVAALKLVGLVFLILAVLRMRRADKPPEATAR